MKTLIIILALIPCSISFAETESESWNQFVYDQAEIILKEKPRYTTFCEKRRLTSEEQFSCIKNIEKEAKKLQTQPINELGEYEWRHSDFWEWLTYRLVVEEVHNK